MNPRRILVIQGHPDTAARHLCHALALAYADGARDAGHEVREIDIAAVPFPLLRSQAQWDNDPVPAGLESAQEAIRWAGHIALFYPLWLGDMPALLKAFLEQVMRPGFAFAQDTGGVRHPGKALSGRSARVVVTMGMPMLAYRLYFGAHTLKSLKRNILRFVGIAPVRDTVIGMAGKLKPARAARLLAGMRKLGERAA